MSGSFTIPGFVVAGLVSLCFVAIASPVSAQGIQTIEPTLVDCEAFVAQNGVPAERPVWQNRGYSGYDVCLNMAYDGDLAGYFASTDTSGDGILQSDEQRAYLDSVIGPVSDPDQSPLTVEKCQGLIDQHGMPQERPFTDWGNRGYGEVEVCQALAYEGDLAGSFATWDANGDDRLDRAETAAVVESLGRNNGGSDSDREPANGGDQDPGSQGSEPETTDSSAGVTPEASGEGAMTNGSSGSEGASSPEATTSAVGAQYGEATGSESTNIVEPTVSEEAEATIPPYEAEETTVGGDDSAPGAGQEPQQGVLSTVSSFVGNVLPSTGGIALAGLAGGVLLIGGGLFAYRHFL